VIEVVPVTVPTVGRPPEPPAMEVVSTITPRTAEPPEVFTRPPAVEASSRPQPRAEPGIVAPVAEQRQPTPTLQATPVSARPAAVAVVPIVQPDPPLRVDLPPARPELPTPVRPPAPSPVSNAPTGVSVRIGTVEVRMTAPPAPPVPPPADDGFDEYARLRSFVFWEEG
jgi:hypothetical protein